MSGFQHIRRHNDQGESHPHLDLSSNALSFTRIRNFQNLQKKGKEMELKWAPEFPMLRSPNSFSPTKLFHSDKCKTKTKKGASQSRAYLPLHRRVPLRGVCSEGPASSQNSIDSSDSYGSRFLRDCFIAHFESR